MLSDTQVRDQVESELDWDPSVDSTKIGVAAKDGVVTLSGKVDSYAEKLAAKRAAERVQGVKAVANEIEVDLPTISTRDDTDIARAAVNALKWSSVIPEDRIKVSVSDGWITLDGEVEWHFQKDAAERAVKYLLGVKGVVNRVQVRPKVKAENVESKIEDALKRSAEVDAKNIQVETYDGKVILRGKVRSWAERDDAEWAAWSAPGVTDVQNEIKVDVTSLVGVP